MSIFDAFLGYSLAKTSSRSGSYISKPPVIKETPEEDIRGELVKALAQLPCKNKEIIVRVKNRYFKIEELG